MKKQGALHSGTTNTQLVKLLILSQKTNETQYEMLLQLTKKYTSHREKKRTGYLTR